MNKLVHLFFSIIIFTLFFGLSPSPAYALNRIGVRQGTNGGEFYDTTTGNKFIFRGNNLYFQASPYKSSDNEAVFTQFEHDGYNSVRIFIPYDQVGNPAGGLSSSYMDSVADFLKRANSHNLYVLPVFDTLPSKGGYYPPGTTPPIWDPTGRTEDPYINEYYMNQSFIDAKKKYLQDVITELHKRNVPPQVILGYQIQNEVRFLSSQKPLSLSGPVQTATGTYNMSDTTQRQTAMAANLVSFTDQVRSAIKQIESDALVNVSLYPPGQGFLTSSYWIFADPASGGSSLDFVDLHPYPWIGPLNKQMGDYQISSHKKPLVLGEFGIDKSHYPNLTNAIPVIRDWQVESCNYNFQGWFTWIWDIGAAETGFYSIIENRGAINGILAPIIRADPCKANAISPTPIPTSAHKPGDFNNDNKVDASDLTILRTEFGTKYTIFDYNNLVANYEK